MKNQQEILQKIIEIFDDLFETDPADIKLEANLYEDLDIDSIDAVDLVIELKKWTGKRIEPDDFKEVRTVQDVVEQVDKLLNES